MQSLEPGEILENQLEGLAVHFEKLFRDNRLHFIWRGKNEGLKKTF